MDREKYKLPVLVKIDKPELNSYGTWIGRFHFDDGTELELKLLSGPFDTAHDALCGMIQLLWYEWIEMKPK